MYDSIVLSGGGIRGLCQLGALHFYYDNDIYCLENIKEFAGTSVGSIVSLLMIIGYTPMELFQQICDHDIFENQDISLWNLVQNQSFTSFDPLDKFIKLLMTEKNIDHDITFLQLKEKYGKELHISGSNLTKMIEEKFDSITSPNMAILSAIRISCNLPLIFPKYVYNDSFYVDGGLLNHYPVDYISDDCKKTLGMSVKTIINNNLKGDTFIGYIYRMIRLAMFGTIKKVESDKITTVNLVDISNELINLSLTNQRKMELFTFGYKDAEKEFNSEIINIPGW